MIYADFDYYQEKYLGQMIDEEGFPRLALRASARIDRMTRYRAENYILEKPEDTRLKDACCAVAEVLFAAEKAAGYGAVEDGRTVRSESNDGYSVSYEAPRDMLGVEAQEGMESACRAAARDHLQATRLLYAGVGHR